jgi:glucose-fructose oxidoreductase
MSGARRTRTKRAEPVRYAVLGLGHIAQVAVLPAFERARRSRLALLVSGDREKREEVSSEYDVPSCDYDDMEALFDREGVEAVYVATPNHLHREHTVRSARSGRHVLCEKPMAPTERDCLAMHEACVEAGVHLMIAYRLHFDPLTLEAVRVATKQLGELRSFSSTFTQNVQEDNVRLEPTSKGGGPLYDIGVYCINAARMLFASEPVLASAFSVRTDDPRFAETETTVAANLQFPDHRLAQFVCSFDGNHCDELRVVGSKGHLRISPAFGYVDELELTVQIGERSPRKKTQKVHDQFSPELDHFAEHIRAGTSPEPDWREGLADVRIIEAILRSASDGGVPIPIDPVPQLNRPSEDQGMRRQRVHPPDQVNVESPSER